MEVISSKKFITFHRAVKFFILEMTVKNYSRLCSRNFKLLDDLEGYNGWCDFIEAKEDGEWGESTDAFQSGQEAAYILKNLFSLKVETLEEMFDVRIDPSTIPNDPYPEVRRYTVDTRSSIESVLEKKLGKKYEHSLRGYPRKGSLLLGIFDPTFGGFQKDLEVTPKYLKELSSRFTEKFRESCFYKVTLVDGLSAFHLDSQNLVHQLFF